MCVRWRTVDQRKLCKFRIYLSEEPNTSVRVKEEAAGGNRGAAARDLEGDDGRQRHINSVPSVTSKA